MLRNLLQILQYLTNIQDAQHMAIQSLIWWGELCVHFGTLTFQQRRPLPCRTDWSRSHTPESSAAPPSVRRMEGRGGNTAFKVLQSILLLKAVFCIVSVYKSSLICTFTVYAGNETLLHAKWCIQADMNYIYL